MLVKFKKAVQGDKTVVKSHKAKDLTIQRRKRGESNVATKICIISTSPPVHYVVSKVIKKTFLS